MKQISLRGLYSSLFLCSLLISCKSAVNNQPGTTPVIDLASSVGGGRVVNLSDIATDVRYVKLETSDSSLIGMFPRVFYENERIYVMALKIVKVFDKEGKFLFKFDRRGRGPQEYSMSRYITAMPSTGNITVQTQAPGESDNLLIYDREGNFVKKVNIPYQRSTFQSKTIKINDNLFVTAASPKYRDSVQLSAIVYDSLFNILKEIPTPYLPEYEKLSDGEVIFISTENAAKPQKANRVFSLNFPEIYKFEDNVRFLTSSNDTIFSIDSKMNYAPAYRVNYGKYKNESPNREDINLLVGDHVSLRATYCIESQQSLILQFYMRNFAHEPYETTMTNRLGTRVQKHTDSYALYNKKTGEFTLLNQPVKGKPGFRDDLMNGPSFIPTHISSDFYASAIFTATEIIEHAETNNVTGDLKKLVTSLKDSDNPVVAIAKMR
ncbi:MAG TPA: hypothetical protein DEO54_00130 [Rikenellaceae bacterium]|nr:MAG: hypothetical protein A2X20_01910 [Bacteroidetes bacterium GWE2_40_15]HBZ24628.1 hypothetical protein [Rikenellaceae bacterium]